MIIDLTRASKQQSILDRYIRAEHGWKPFETKLREPQNCVKHATSDPDRISISTPRDRVGGVFDVLMFIELPTCAATRAMTLFMIYASGTDWGRDSFALVRVLPKPKRIRSRRCGSACASSRRPRCVSGTAGYGCSCSAKDGSSARSALSGLPLA